MVQHGDDVGGDDDINEQVARIEETRSEMSDTIDAIQQKLSPDVIKEQATEAVRDATLGRAERGVGDASARAGQAASGVTAMIKQHPAEVASAVTTMVAMAVALGVRMRLRPVEKQEEPCGTRVQMVMNQLRPFGARVGKQSEAQGRMAVARDQVWEAATSAQQAIDDTRTTLSAALAGSGLSAAGRFIGMGRQPNVTSMMRVSGMMKSRWMVPAVLAPAAAGVWAAQRLMGKGSETGQDLLLAWLNDAYGMETALIQTLQNHARDARAYPQLQSKLDQHLAQTRRHAEMVKRRIDHLGGSTNSIKTTLAMAMGKVQGLSTGAAADQVVKDGLADFAAENFEIASYSALIAAAQQVGDRETVVACQQILREEQEMAHWLEQNLPTITRESMNRLTASRKEL